MIEDYYTLRARLQAEAAERAALRVEREKRARNSTPWLGLGLVWLGGCAVGFWTGWWLASAWLR